MGSIERRLARLERVADPAGDGAIRREMLRRLTDEELDALEAAIGSGEDAPILGRVRELEEEVRIGHTTAS